MQPLTVPGDLGELSTIGQYVLAAASEAGLDKAAAYRLRLSVDEIATNIIIHGYDEAGLTGNVVVSAEIDEDGLRLFLDDTAIPYDPLQQVAPSGMDQPLEEREIGGLGVFLALQGVDEFRYERVGNHNRNIFVMRRPTASPDGQATRQPTSD